VTNSGELTVQGGFGGPRLRRSLRGLILAELGGKNTRGGKSVGGEEEKKKALWGPNRVKTQTGKR